MGETQEIVLRAAQKELLDTLRNRFEGFRNQVLPKLNELAQAYNETLFFVRKDLDVPENFGLNEDFTKFVKMEPPHPVQVQTAEPVTEGKDG